MKICRWNYQVLKKSCITTSCQYNIPDCNYLKKKKKDEEDKIKFRAIKTDNAELYRAIKIQTYTVNQ